VAPLEAILFDIDGTLYDSDPIHFCAFRDLLQQVCTGRVKFFLYNCHFSTAMLSGFRLSVFMDLYIHPLYIIVSERIKMPKRGVNWASLKNNCKN
jgi:hypothetical protein